MSHDTSKMNMEDQEKLDENIKHIKGVFELVYWALTSETPISSESGVLTVIADAQNRMEEVEKAIDVLTAA
jgi:ribose 5-phosphate isomerase